MRLINISGGSGVGKTTIATLCRYLLDDSTHVCGDDLHKWERGDKNWEIFTHLNPEANNLDLGRNQILQLFSGKEINRDVYDHNTGRFIKGVSFKPSKTIINEGLHALHDEVLNNLSDLNIFVDTDEGLKIEWKVNRDTQKRGYTRSQVIESIKKRKQDETNFIDPQKEKADVILKFLERKNEEVDLDHTFLTKRGESFIKKLKSLYTKHKGFLTACKKLSFEHDLVQSLGGNVSYKFGDTMIITSSGKSMRDVSMLSGYTVCNLKKYIAVPDSERDYDKLMQSSKIITEHLRPSMESGLHAKVMDSCVIHTHPIHVNTILCSKQAKELLPQILNDVDYDFIEYTTPGSELFMRFKDNNKVILLENHGLICSAENMAEAFEKSYRINKAFKMWLIKHSLVFKSFSDGDKSEQSGYLFPDAVALEDKMSEVHDYILQLQREVGLTPNFLSNKDVDKIKNMESEKYRSRL